MPKCTPSVDEITQKVRKLLRKYIQFRFVFWDTPGKFFYDQRSRQISTLGTASSPLLKKTQKNHYHHIIIISIGIIIINKVCLALYLLPPYLTSWHRFVQIDKTPPPHPPHTTYCAYNKILAKSKFAWKDNKTEENYHLLHHLFKKKKHLTVILDHVGNVFISSLRSTLEAARLAWCTTPPGWTMGCGTESGRPD